MKRIVLVLAGILLCGRGAQAEGKLEARLNRADGRAWRVVLTGCDDQQLSYHLEKSTAPKTMPLTDVGSLVIKLPELKMDALQEQLTSADYRGVISVLEPAVRTCGTYMALTNNVVGPFALLTKAYLRNGDSAKALAAAKQLQLVSDPAVQGAAKSIAAQAVLEAGDVEGAKAMLGKLDDEVAALYLQARIERAEKRSREAMQTVIKLIATHPNDHNWMPRTELFCAELYIDLERLDSAAEVARQVQILYPGSEFRIEAKQLAGKIKQLIEEAEQAAESE